MKEIVIIGAGGLGRETAFLIELINETKKEWHILGFLDDNINVGTRVNNYEVIGDNNWLEGKSVNAVVAISNPLIKQRIVEEIVNSDVKFPILIHPDVDISKTSSIGIGSIVFQNTTITTNVKIGDFVLINYNVSIGHDVMISSYSSVLPNSAISGNVMIKEKVLVGAKSIVLQGLTVGNSATVGAGAVVTKDVLNNTTVIGVPAKEYKGGN